MPARKKHDHVNCQYFRWRLFQRNGVWYADGRFETLNLGKHSLGTRDRAEAEANLRKLDYRMAVRCGLAKDTGVDPDERLEVARGWERYLKWCERPEVMGGVSRKTLNKYRRSSELHQEFCTAHSIRYWNDFGKAELDDYGRILNPKFSARSLYFELTQVKTVLNWLIDEKHLPGEAKFRFRLSKPEGNETYCYTPEQVQAMLRLCDGAPGLFWLGNIIRVLACTGLRIAELAGLRWTDIDFTGNAIRLTDERSSHRRSTMGTARRTKGKRSRTIPLHPAIKSLLTRLPRVKHGHVLTGPKGGKINEDRIRERFVEQVIKPLEDSFPTPQGEIGFEHARFHSFRHYFISQAFISGATEAEIMDWVGHRDSRTVAIYRHLRNEDSLRRMEQIEFLRPDTKLDGPEEAA
jgi:integrase